jgi:plastocyanin
MDGTVFFPLGIGLVVAALVLSFVGIRGKATFPPSRPVMVGLSLLFAAVVASTATLAVVNAKEEKDHRDEEIAEEEAEAAEEEKAEEAVAPPATGEPPAGGATAQAPGAAGGEAGGGTSLDVTSPEDGGLSFEPTSLTAAPGTVTILYANPSAVPHNIAVEGGGAGGILGETETFSAGEQELVLDNVGAGEYVYYCTVPGHRQGGMEGDLTVE